MSRGGDLLRLQEIDARLSSDRRRLLGVETQLAGDPELDRMRRDARRLRREQVDIDAQVASAEKEGDALRRRLRELDRHLYDGSIRNPQELLSMQHDLEGVRARVAAHDEHLLALMETAESAAAAHAAARASMAEREGTRLAGSGALAEQIAALRVVVDQHERDREELVTGLIAADLALYERLARRLQPAVVHTAADACGGCHMPFSGSEVRRIRAADGLVQCAECDRIVVP